MIKLVLDSSKPCFLQNGAADNRCPRHKQPTLVYWRLHRRAPDTRHVCAMTSWYTLAPTYKTKQHLHPPFLFPLLCFSTRKDVSDSSCSLQRSFCRELAHTTSDKNSSFRAHTKHYIYIYFLSKAPPFNLVKIKAVGSSYQRTFSTTFHPTDSLFLSHSHGATRERFLSSFLVFARSPQHAL